MNVFILARHQENQHGQGQQLAEERQEEQEAQARQGETRRQEVKPLAGVSEWSHCGEALRKEKGSAGRKAAEASPL
jgi:hypothetical protein